MKLKRQRSVVDVHPDLISPDRTDDILELSKVFTVQ